MWGMSGGEQRACMLGPCQLEKGTGTGGETVGGHQQGSPCVCDLPVGMGCGGVEGRLGWSWEVGTFF